MIDREHIVSYCAPSLSRARDSGSAGLLVLLALLAVPIYWGSVAWHLIAWALGWPLVAWVVAVVVGIGSLLFVALRPVLGALATASLIIVVAVLA